jgi:acetyl esterase/lipase
MLAVAAGLWLGSAALAQGGAAPSLRVESDVVYGHKLGMALTLDMVRPAQANGAGVLFMVSGGWVSRWNDTQASVASGAFQQRFGALLDRGFTLLLVRHGSSPLFKVPDAVSDVREAVRWVRQHAADLGVDPERLGVFGGSAGGHLSLMLGLAGGGTVPARFDGSQATADAAVEPVKVAAVAAYFPPVDLRRLVGPSERFPALDFDPELADDVSPLLFVTPDDPPVLLVHGTADTLVPLSNSQILHEALGAERVESRLIVLEGAGHGFEGEQAKQAITAVADWFAQHLAPARAAAPASITTPQR